MAQPNVTFEGISAHKQAVPEKPRILFVKGIPDDGMIKITAEKVSPKQAMEQVDGYDSATFLTRHIPGSLHHFVSIPGMVNDTLILTGSKNQTLKFSIPHVIVNCMTDADVSTRALGKLDTILTRLRRDHATNLPVINPPEGIRRTARQRIYEQFKDLPGLTIPHVIRIAPNSVADTVKQVNDHGIKPPFLIREAGKHTGKGMQLINGWGPEELLKLERYAYDGREFYVTAWVDFKSADGLYRKARIMCIGGVPMPRHLVTTAGWDTHLRWRKELMASSEALRQEEADFLAKPLAQSLNNDACESLKRIYETLGLDYFGIDGSIRADGSLLVFEINAAFNAMDHNHDALYAHLDAAVKANVDAFNNVIASKAALLKWGAA